VNPELVAERERLRSELRALRGSWEYAFAMGSARMVGDHPRYRDVRRLEAELVARISELDED
jgi:hypothetical protein